MSATLPILDSIRKRIEDKTEQFSIELFPDDLEHYNLTDEFGAVLVQYAGSKFESIAVVGFKPTNCTACHLISEEFAGEADGLWQYQLIVQTETWQVELCESKDLPKFTAALSRRAGNPKPNQP